MRIPTWLAVMMLAFSPVLCSGQIVISELMYNPDSNEGRPPDRNDPEDVGELNAVEWVELYNVGDDPVDVSGWTLRDEDGTSTALPDGAVIEPGQAILLIPSVQSVAGFRAAWGEDLDVYPVGQWGDDGLYNLSNAPSPSNEIIRIVDAEGQAVDVVNYDDEGDWPSDRPDGASIYLPPDVIDAEKNDEGFNWRRSELGVHGAINNTPTGSFNGIDTGSPGTVQTTNENPTGDDPGNDQGDEAESDAADHPEP